MLQTNPNPSILGLMWNKPITIINFSEVFITTY